MRRRGKAVKKQRSKSLVRIAAKGVRRRKPPTVDPTERIALLTRERDEALEQQTATSEVLKVLSRSMFDLQPVLDTLVEKAVRLSGADRGFIFRQDGDVYRVAASFGHSKEFIEIAKQNPIRQDRGSATGRAVLERGTVHIHDIQADPEYRWAEDHSGEEEMHRTILAVPMLRESEIIGVIVIRRIRVQPFTEKQIELVTNFAAQAVIAIENTRLLTELRESLQQQTATADVLKVISRSTFDLQTVLDTLVQSAARLCEAEMASVTRPRDVDGAYYHVARFGFSPEWFEYMQMHPLRPERGTLVGRALLERRVVHIPDVLTDREYKSVKAQQLGQFRAILGVPMLRGEATLGVFFIARRTPRPFTDKQIELVTTFADQAAIAIENVRLFDEVQARTRDLSESLEQQTATSEVLQVISSSPGDLQPVFEAMLSNATRLCEASFGTMWLVEGADNEFMRTVAMHGALPTAYRENWGLGTLIKPNPRMPSARVINTLKPVQVTDLREDSAYLDGDPLVVSAVEIAEIRSLISIPMLKEDKIVGAIAIYRQQVCPFTDKQIELVTNFAAQAVIAIENTRLLKELRESLQQQTATADVLKVISRSTFDLKTVLQTLVEFAARLCDADSATITRQKDGVFYRADHTASLANSWIMSKICQSRSNEVQRPGARYSKARRSISLMFCSIPNTHFLRASG